MGDVLDELKGLEGTWKDTEAAEGPERLPDGRYQTKVKDVTIGRSQSGRLQIHWELEILAGDAKGKAIHKYDGLETEQNLSYVKRGLRTLGLDIPKKMRDLPEVLEDALNAELEVTLRTRDEAFPPNCYFNRLLSSAATGRPREPKLKPKTGKQRRY